MRFMNLTLSAGILVFMVAILALFSPESPAAYANSHQQVCNDAQGSQRSLTTDTAQLAVKFTAPPGGLTLNTATLDIRKDIGGTGTVTIGIWNHDSFADSPLGSPIATDVKSLANLPTNYGDYDCDTDTFSSPTDVDQSADFGSLGLTGGESYWLGIRITGNGGDAVRWNALADSSDWLCSGVDDWASCFGTWGLSYAIYGEVTAPAPTPTPTNTPSPGERWDVARFTCDRPDLGLFVACAGDDASSIPIVDGELNGFDVVQPFRMEATATADKIWVDVTKTGSPTVGILGYLTELNGASKSIDSTADLLASFVISPDDFSSESAVLIDTVDLSSTVNLVTGQDYGIWLSGVCGAGDCDTAFDRYYWSYATATDSFDAPDWPWSMAYNGYRSPSDISDPETWVTYPENPAWVIHAFRILGFPEGVSTGATPTPTPSDPPDAEADPGVTQYDYTADDLNKIIGFSPLSYSFTSMENDTSFAIRKIDLSGNPTATLATVLVQPDTADVGSFSVSTISFGEGPIDVYDVTNGQRLVKHYVMEAASARTSEARPHRCNASCFVALEPIAKLDTLTGHQYQATQSSHVSLTSVNYGDDFRLYYQYPNASDTDDAKLVIRNLDTFENVVDVSLTTLVVNQFALGTSSYDQSQLIFNTEGNAVPYVQIRNLHTVYDASFPPGVYNYALVDANDGSILSEGESLLVVRPENETKTVALTAPDQLELGEKFTSRTVYPDAIICRAFLDWNWSATEPDISFGTAPSTCKTSNPIEHTMPDSTLLDYPVNGKLNLRTNPFFVPFASDPSVYGMTILSNSITFVEECDFTCTLGQSVPDVSSDNKGIFSLIIIAASFIGLTVKLGFVAGAFGGGIAAGTLVWREWLPPEIILTIAIITGAIILVVMLLRRTGDTA